MFGGVRGSNIIKEKKKKKKITCSKVVLDCLENSEKKCKCGVSKQP